jgi:hypothetical protein
MGEGPIDAYADQVTVTIGPFGCALNFAVSPAIPSVVGTPVAGQPVGTVRMSLEHLKIVAYLVRRQLLKYEQDSGVRVAMPMDVLNRLGIGLEDWEECWGGGSR